MLNTSALREHRYFRRLFLAQLVSHIGSQVTLVAVLVQVFELTNSPLATGAVGAAQAIPIVLFGMWGGAVADAYDRRRVLVVAQIALTAVACCLALLATLDSPWLPAIYILAAVGAALSAIDGATRTAVVPMVVDHGTLRSAVQLREVLIQSGRVVGPLLAGGLIATTGLASAYALDAATFVVALILLAALPPLAPTEARSAGWSSIREALQFIRKTRVLASTFIADLIAMILGMPRAVFPALAVVVFDAGAREASWLFAAPAAGAMIGLLFIGITDRVRREGLAVLLSVSLWGASIAAAALSPSIALALVALAVAGWADMLSAVFRQTILLTVTPDNLRGRMGAAHTIVVTGGPPLGDIEAGVAASVLGVRASVAAGGIACIAGMGLLAAWCPQFARWTDPARGRPAR